jgi:hypothetical protein
MFVQVGAILRNVVQHGTFIDLETRVGALARVPYWIGALATNFGSYSKALNPNRGSNARPPTLPFQMRTAMAVKGLSVLERNLCWM